MFFPCFFDQQNSTYGGALARAYSIYRSLEFENTLYFGYSTATLTHIIYIYIIYYKDPQPEYTNTHQFKILLFGIYNPLHDITIY